MYSLYSHLCHIDIEERDFTERQIFYNKYAIHLFYFYKQTIIFLLSQLILENSYNISM